MRYSVSVSLPSADSVQVDRVMDTALTSGSLQSATVVSDTVMGKEQGAMGKHLFNKVLEVKQGQSGKKNKQHLNQKGDGLVVKKPMQGIRV